MKKLRDKLIHLLGGLTEEDIRVRTRPVPVHVEQKRMEKIRMNYIIRPEMSEQERYMDFVKRDMANGICDKMLDAGMILFETRDDPSGMPKLTATATVVYPEVV